MAPVVASQHRRCSAGRATPSAGPSLGRIMARATFLDGTPARRRMTVDGSWSGPRRRPAAGSSTMACPTRWRGAAGHGEVGSVFRRSGEGIRKAGLPCHMLPTARPFVCRSSRAHEPDALVYWPKLPHDAIEVAEPVGVVEVATPSTRRIDASLKLTGYLGVPSVQHYLIVDPDGPPVVHHDARRTELFKPRSSTTGRWHCTARHRDRVAELFGRLSRLRPAPSALLEGGGQFLHATLRSLGTTLGSAGNRTRRPTSGRSKKKLVSWILKPLAVTLPESVPLIE